jgi:hypothetical protein
MWKNQPLIFLFFSSHRTKETRRQGSLQILRSSSYDMSNLGKQPQMELDFLLILRLLLAHWEFLHLETDLYDGCCARRAQLNLSSRKKSQKLCSPVSGGEPKDE